MKSYDELMLTDDFLFCRILEKNPELCKELAGRIIGRKIGRIVTLQDQKTIQVTPDGHGIRLDVYFEDDAETVYDIEMQTGHYEEIPRRMRYYQGGIDQAVLEKGENYAHLRESWIIFICEKDVRREGRNLYTYSLRDDHDPSQVMDDGTHRVLFCLEGNQQNLTEDQKQLIACMTGADTQSALGLQIHREVQEARRTAEWRRQYMKYEYDMYLARKDGWTEGHEKGREEGREEGLRALVATLCQYEPDPAKLLLAVRRNPAYENITEERLKEILQGEAIPS